MSFGFSVDLLKNLLSLKTTSLDCSLEKKEREREKTELKNKIVLTHILRHIKGKTAKMEGVRGRKRTKLKTFYAKSSFWSD